MIKTRIAANHPINRHPKSGTTPSRIERSKSETTHTHKIFCQHTNTISVRICSNKVFTQFPPNREIVNTETNSYS